MRIPVFKSAKTKAQNSAFNFATQKVQFLFFECHVCFDLTAIKYLSVVNQEFQTSSHKRAQVKAMSIKFIGGAKGWLDLHMEENMCYGMVIYLLTNVVTSKI